MRVCVGKGNDRERRTSEAPLLPPAPHMVVVFVVNPVTCRGGPVEEKDVATSHGRLLSLHKTGCGEYVGSCPTMASWALLLLASALLGSPGKDSLLSEDLDNSPSLSAALSARRPFPPRRVQLQPVHGLVNGERQPGGGREPGRGSSPTSAGHCVACVPPFPPWALPLHLGYEGHWRRWPSSEGLALLLAHTG